jgi:curved DNA-binding protein
VQFKDYYKVMGIARDATEAQVKQAYRRLARKYHPDVSKLKDAEARFKELGEAYEVLKDPEKRAAYDRLGDGPQPGEDFRAPPGWDSGFEFRGAGQGPGAGPGGQTGGYSDFFESLFGRAGGFAPAQGEDHHAKILLDLEAALHGGARMLTLRLPEIDAGGHLLTRERTLNVQIPKGILAGQTIWLSGQGARGPGSARAGDLFIEVEFLPHPLYRVDGRDLLLTLPVAPWEAALGATVQAPTPAGPVELKIPVQSHGGSKLRLKGRGIPASPPGDLYVELQIALPPATDAKSREAYAAFAAAVPFNPRAGLRSPS